MGQEKDLEEKAKKIIERRGGLFLKFISPGTTGVPDRVIILPGGRIYFVEFKRPAGVFSKRQIFVAKEFLKRGTEVINIIDEKSLKDFTDEI